MRVDPSQLSAQTSADGGGAGGRLAEDQQRTARLADARVAPVGVILVTAVVVVMGLIVRVVRRRRRVMTTTTRTTS